MLGEISQFQGRQMLCFCSYADSTFKYMRIYDMNIDVGL